MTGQERVLLVVDQRVSDARVIPHSVRLIIERDADEVYVVAPLLTTRLAWATNDDAKAIADAQQRLTDTLQQLYDQDVYARGSIGSDDAILTVIADTLTQFPADEIIIAIHTDHDQRWREQNLAQDIRDGYPQPLTELLVHADETVSIRT